MTKAVGVAGAEAPADGDERQAFAAAEAIQAEAEARSGAAFDEVLMIGGLSCRLRIVGSALADQLLPALAHHPHLDPGTRPDVEIRAWDARSTGSALPHYPESALDGGTSGAARIQADRQGDAVRVRYQPDERTLSLFDPSRGLALFCVADPTELPYWERGAPLRTIFHWLMEPRGRCLVHAAAVGHADGGVLIVGRGGSGKSTTALTCLGSGVGYLADDYCIVEVGAGPVATAHSLYSSGKVDGEQLRRFPDLAEAVANPDRLDDEKALVFVGEAATDQLINRFPVRAVVVPVIAGGTDTTAAPTSAGAALRALAPSSVLQLPGGGATAMAMLGRLVRTTPCIELRLGTDLTRIPGRIDDLLQQLGSST